LYIGLKFFGPQVGSFFLLLSKNRNETGPGDTIAPAAPKFSQTPDATNVQKLTINGITEPGATVKLFVNGPEKHKTTADNDGFFTFIDIKLSKGNNIIFAKSFDEVDNESEKSEVLYIQYDDKIPEIEITKPTNGEKITNLNKRILVEGKTNEEANVKINGRVAIVRADNTFELLLGVSEGNVEIKVEATDKAGNKAEEKIYITYVKD